MALCVVRCWLCSLSPETAGTRRDREPSQTDPGGPGSLRKKEHTALQLLHWCYYPLETIESRQTL